jgi:hypothetical protein
MKNCMTGAQEKAGILKFEEKKTRMMTERERERKVARGNRQ